MVKKFSKKEIEDIIYRRQIWFEKIKAKWIRLGIEAVVCPPYPSCAFKFHNGPDASGILDNTIIWNLTNFPSGVVPVTEVLPGEDQGYEDSFNDRFTRGFTDDIKGSVGMPLGVQVVGWSY
mmetsp:Transcript_44810/g.43410  ORF Transcript_44810/g.43410 Transcript_44810/m.43410 type:complete len:121 (+) Transcript_44810:1089-1451(+)